MKTPDRPKNSTIVVAIVFVVLAVIVSGTVINMDRECITAGGELFDNGYTYGCKVPQ